ncbi:MAG TPA: hypothetical protein VKA31_09325, partial [Mariprofundaceae bacterium]|nr:hypothetical protein [Mariprofundaceae bacterium]
GETENGARAAKLGCYCTIWDKNPAFLEKQNIPPGYCGLCDKCGKPGHTRHFPGAAPFTGTWCERHYRQAMILHPLGRIGILLYGIPVIAFLMLLLFMQ